MTAIAELFVRVIQHARRLLADALDDLPFDAADPEGVIDPVVILHRAVGYVTLLGVIIAQAYARSRVSAPKTVMTLVDLYVEAVFRRVQHSAPAPF